MGTIAEVRAELSDWEDAKARALDIAEREAMRCGPINAEIVGDVSPSWHILTVEPMRETTAAAHLIARRFGVYLPTVPILRLGRGGRISMARLAPMFPGYLFVFVWDVARHWGRMRALPGVRNLMLQGDGAPAVISDHLINAVQVTEFMETERAMKPKRRRGAAHRVDVGDKLTIRSKSYWREHLEGLAPDARIRLLARALEIGS